jgi:hypothetical protein
MGGFRWPLTNGSAIDSIAPQRRTASYTILSRTCHVTRGIFLLSRAPCGTRGQRLLLVSPLLMTIFAGAPGTTRTCDLRFRGPINAFADVSQRLPSRWSPSATPSFDVPHPLARRSTYALFLRRSITSQWASLCRRDHPTDETAHRVAPAISYATGLWAFPLIVLVWRCDRRRSLLDEMFVFL